MSHSSFYSISGANKKLKSSSRFTKELVLIMEKILLRIPEQISSSFCCLRWRWMWWRTTGSRMRRDSEWRKIVSNVRKENTDKQLQWMVQQNSVVLTFSSCAEYSTLSALTWGPLYRKEKPNGAFCLSLYLHNFFHSDLLCMKYTHNLYPFSTEFLKIF